MRLFERLKNLFVPSEEAVQDVKMKMWQFLKQATKRDNLTDFELVYGKLAERKDSFTTRKTEYHNYAIAFSMFSGAIIILPIDPKLASYGWPVFINEETLKSAKTILFGTAYEFDLKDGNHIIFETPAQNYKIGNALGAREIPIMQEEEVKAFKAFFRMRFG